MQLKRSETGKTSYQGLCTILFLHFLPQLLEAGLQAVVERPQRLCDLLSVDANTFGEVRDLAGEQKCEKPSSDIPRRDEMHYPYIQFNSRDLWPLWLCTLSTISECTSVCVHEKGNIPATLPRWKQTILEKAVAMTLPPSASHRQHQHIIT